MDRCHQTIFLPFMDAARRQRLPIIGLTAVVTSMTLGCGAPRPQPQPTPPPPILPLVTARERPQSYVLHDPACQNRMELSTNPLKIAKTWVRQNSAAGVFELPVNLPEAETQNSLRSPSVSETTFGQRYQRVCDFRKPKTSRCRDTQGDELPFLLEETRGGLKICRNEYPYPKDSYEGVALTSVYSLDKTYAYYREAVADNGPPMPQVSLSILPTFEELYDFFPHQGGAARLQTFITHNLAYFPGSTEIVVFPESVLTAGPQSLWESPFVLSHEYGHHIDHVRHGHLYQQAELRWSPILHRFMESSEEHFQEPPAPFSGEIPPASGSPEPPLPAALTPRSLLLTALSEAFADLIAFYSQGESSESLQGFMDIVIDRDVGFSRFASGLPKRLESDYLKVFFDQRGRSSPPRSELAPMSGVHTIGAIFAHGVQKFATQLAEPAQKQQAALETPSADQDAQVKKFKYQLVLHWMEAVVSELTHLPVRSSDAECLTALSTGFRKTLDHALTEYQILLTTDERRQLQSTALSALAEDFPALRF